MSVTTIPDIPAGSRWYAYLRDSGHEKQTASCDQQDGMVREVLAQAGASLKAPPFRDEARKGSTTVGRAALDELMVAAKRDRADGVIFWSSARMAREVNDAQIIRGTLRKWGYRLYYIADQVPNIGVWTPLLEVVQDIRNAQYLETLSKEIKRAHTDLLKLGYAPTGKPPAVGYRIVREQYATDRDGAPVLGVRWVKDEAVAARVRQAWEMRLGGYGYETIQNATRLLRYTTSHKRLFENKLYMGTLVWGGRAWPGFVEPYVTPDEFERVQALGRERAAAHPRRLGVRRLLSGVVVCPTCGGNMVAKTIGAGRYRHYYYICHAKDQGASNCAGRMIRLDRLDARVLSDIRNVYTNRARLAELYATWQAEVGQGGALEAEIAELERERDAHRAAVGNLLELAKLGQFASVADELTATEQKLAAAEATLVDLRQRSQQARQLVPLDALPSFAEKLQAAYEGEDLETARLLLRRLVSKVTIDPDGTPHVWLRPVVE